MKKKALLLVRVSTVQQDYEAQKNELISYAHSQGYNVIKIIEDKESAIKLSEEERHGLNEMKQYLIENQDCKMVIVWELSRLARTEKVLHSVKDWLVSRKVNLHVLQENITLLDKNGNETSTGSLMFSIFGHFCSQEMRLKKERVARTTRAKAEKGKFLGGRCCKYGYKKNENGYIVIDEKSSLVVKLVFSLYSTNNYSVSTLKTELESRGIKFSWERINAILSDKSYIGNTSGRCKVFEHYPQIISNEMYDKVQAIKKENNTTKTKESKHFHFGQKIVRCVKCDSACCFSANSADGEYVCSHKKYYKKLAIEKCESEAINAKIMDACLSKVARDVHTKYMINLNSATIKEIKDKLDIIEIKIDTAKREIEKANKKLERAKILYVNGDFSTDEYTKEKAKIQANTANYKALLKGYKKEKKQLKSTLDDINNEDEEIKEDRALGILFDVDEYADERINKIIHKHICSAYITKMTYKEKDIRVIVVNTKQNEQYTFVNDYTSTYKDRSKAIQLYNNGFSPLFEKEVTPYLKSMVGDSAKELYDKIEPFRKVVKDR